MRTPRDFLALFRQLSCVFLFVLSLLANQVVAQERVRVIMLGDKGHHQPSSLYRAIQKPLAEVGIDLEYSDDVDGTLNKSRLEKSDALLIYANIDTISDSQEKAMREYVASGRGLVPLHCATYCFRNSDAYIKLVGGQFKEHGGERFSTQIVLPEHEIMKGFGGFESWDETYVHHKHNAVNRIVLEERRQGRLAAGTTAEPWTWIRTHEKGRVFYTAWGHNLDTWQQPGFHNLLERGIRWAAGKSLANVAAFSDRKMFPIPEMTTVPKDLPPFTFTDVGDKIPNYTPGPRRAAQGKLKSKMQDPLSPEVSVQHYVTPKQFEMKIWASEADAKADAKAYAGLSGKPLAMNWDHRGRLWVCESIDYPNELQPPGQGRDRIRICEDTDHDGVADKFTVFATHLSIPTALVCCRGGALVQDGQQTVFLKDTDGDDVADMRQELITGWGIGDTHGGVSNFQYGLDNWIWAMQGYNDSTPVINGEPQQRFRQGFWRFAVEPSSSNEKAPVYALKNGQAVGPRSTDFENHSIRVSKLEFVRSTNNNTWGLGISEEGLIFGSTANNNPSGFMPIANRYYERVNGWSTEVLKPIADSNQFKAITPNIRQVDWHGGYTAAAGHALYTARKYPKSWWNRVAFVCEPTGHLVGTFVLDRVGAGYRSTNPFNLVASDDEWAAPTMAEVGPDGNVWVLDWYNFIVQHNPTPEGFKTGKGNAYENDLRDKKYGRVYRVVYNGSEGMDPKAHQEADAAVRSGLDSANEASLVAALKHPTMLWRRTAQRLLIERQSLSPSTMKSLQGLIDDASVDSNGLNVGAIHALWVLHGLKPAKLVAFSPAIQDGTPKSSVLNAFHHKSPGVRRNALMVAPANSQTFEALLKANLLSDSDPQVRLAAILKVSEIPEFSDELGKILSRPDRLAQLSSGSTANSDRWLLDAWTSAAAAHAIEVLPLLLAQNDWLPSEDVLKQIEFVAQHAARSKLDSSGFQRLVVAPKTPSVASVIFSGLAKGWPKDYGLSISSEAQEKVVRLWLNSDLPVEAKSQVLQLASIVGIKDLGPEMAKMQKELMAAISDSTREPANRVGAASQAIILQPENRELVSLVLGQISAQSSPEFSSGMLQALSGSRLPGIADMLIERSKKLTPEFRKNALRILLSRPQSTLELLESIEAGKLSLGDLQLDQKQSLRDHPNESVRSRAVALMKLTGGVPNSDRQKVLDAWMPVTKESGDLANGKAMYQKHCSLCHIHGEIGVNIGPNLTGMAVHPKAELLMNILDPSRSVEGNFKTYSVRTTDNLVLTGMLASESKTSIELINSQGKKEVVLRDDIDELIASQKSLMPEGFEGQMSRKEMTDLLEFLTSKGKYVPLPLDSIASTITTKGMFSDENNNSERLAFRDWSPKTVREVPFVLIDPQGGKVANAIMLYGSQGKFPPTKPKQVELICETSAVAIHMLSGVGGWSFPASKEGTLSMIVRLHYTNGKTEDHKLINGQHFADYIRRVDVPKSEFAFDLNGRQIRYLSVKPSSRASLAKIELIKGDDITSPVVMGITIQTTE
jgi:putative membrane-bound dehydrogenase-like protein